MLLQVAMEVCKDEHSTIYNTIQRLCNILRILALMQMQMGIIIVNKKEPKTETEKHYNQSLTRCIPPHIYWWKCAYPPTNRRLDFHIAATNAPAKQASSRSCCKPVLASLAMVVVESEDVEGAVPEVYSLLA